jgi:phosphatidylglycerol:prolipoprotein diacylglycerol transferase
VTGYFVWVAVGIVCAFVARRLVGPTTALGEPQRTGLLFLAIGGAILGAYAFQSPADWLGWSAAIDARGAVPDGMPLGGRTVLGGMIGGWLAVEAGKRAFGIRIATGDDFALPLAIALGFGRLGCMAGGCCVGRVCAPHPLAYVDAHGVAHVPVQLVEACFHFSAAIAIFVATRRGVLAGRRLAAYLALYALVRFALEFERVNPVVALGISYHQFLALLLLAIAGTTFVRRTIEARRTGRSAGDDAR